MSEYGDTALTRLRAPEDDAEALAGVLGDPDIGGFEIAMVSNQGTFETKLAIAEFFDGRRADDLLLLHFSCHGVKSDSGELYFATANTKLKYLAATAVPAAYVTDAMTRCRAGTIIVLLDCCYAGAFARGRTPRAAGTVDVGDRLGGRGRAVVTACTALQYAFEDGTLSDEAPEARRPSVFTSEVVRGLSTGEADLNQDGEISVDELYDYVYDRVTEATPDQTPQKSVFELTGSVYVARRKGPLPTREELKAEPEREREPEQTEPPGPGSQAPVQVPPSWWRRHRWAVGAAAAVAASALVTATITFWPWERTTAGESPQDARLGESVLVVPQGGGEEPDGLLLVDSGTGRTRTVLDGVVARYPTIAPGRSEVAYLRRDGEGSSPYLVVDGDWQRGRPLLDARGRVACPFTGPIAWSPDGTRIAFICWPDVRVKGGLWVADADGSDAEKVLDDTTAGYPTWRGDEIVYVRTGPGSEPSRLAALDVATGATRPVTAGGEGWDSLPTWSPESGLVVFLRSGGRHQPGDIWSVDEAGTERRVTDVGDVQHLTVSPDGSEVAWVSEDGTLWRLPLGGGTPTEVAEGDGLGPPAWGPR